MNESSPDKPDQPEVPEWKKAFDEDMAAMNPGAPDSSAEPIDMGTMYDDLYRDLGLPVDDVDHPEPTPRDEHQRGPEAQ